MAKQRNVYTFLYECLLCPEAFSMACGIAFVAISAKFPER